MKMAYVNDIRRTDLRLSARINAALSTLGERFAQYRVYRKTVAELNSLSDRELADLAISRSNIGSIAYEAAYKA